MITLTNCKVNTQNAAKKSNNFEGRILTPKTTHIIRGGRTIILGNTAQNKLCALFYGRERQCKSVPPRHPSQRQSQRQTPLTSGNCFPMRSSGGQDLAVRNYCGKLKNISMIGFNKHTIIQNVFLKNSQSLCII